MFFLVWKVIVAELLRRSSLFYCVISIALLSDYAQTFRQLIIMGGVGGEVSQATSRLLVLNASRNAPYISHSFP